MQTKRRWLLSAIAAAKAPVPALPRPGRAPAKLPPRVSRPALAAR